MSFSLRSYIVAILCSALALLLTLVIDDPLTAPNTLLLLVAAVMCSSWYGGVGPGLIATVLTAIAFMYFYIPHPFSLELGSSDTVVRLVEFTAVCIFISALNEVRRRAQAHAEAARIEAEAANRVKAEFVAAVSHELRTPLAAIIGWAEVLRTSHGDASTFADAVDRIERNARAESHLIEDLLDLSRIDAGHLRLRLRPMDIWEAIEASIDTVRPALAAKHIDLRTTSLRPAVAVSGDLHRLQQVFWNLLSNAVKFTPEGGRIDVILDRTNSHVQVRVRDTGCGIEPDFLPYVFDRFRQGSDADAKRLAGLGLGLAIARHLVELHGGTIRAESAGSGCGALFAVELPITTEQVRPNIAA